MEILDGESKYNNNVVVVVIIVVVDDTYKATGVLMSAPDHL